MNDLVLTDQERALGGLMEVAESQQHAVDTVLNGLKHLHGNLTHAVAELETLGQKLPVSVESAATQGVARALHAQLQTVSEATMRAMAIAFKPQYERLKAATAAAETADQALKKTVAGIEGRLHHAEKQFGWRWALVAGALTCGAIVALAAAAWSVVWWQREQLTDLQTQNERLITEIVQGQTMLEQLTKKTGGVRYVVASDGRFIIVPKGFDPTTCLSDHLPCS
jgi:hypothetical protein